MKTVVRVNGVGSAWPVLIGETHPVYSTGRLEDLSNASYSLINFQGDSPKSGTIQWEIMIDMGHYTIPFLINNENRIPEAVILTHGHADHFFGVDWVVQSYYSKYGIKKKYPVYATKQVWDSVLRTFGYLGQITEHKELLPGETLSIEEIPGLSVTAIPVFHGESAKGASMLYFENAVAGMKPVLFTGDLLCPLWRKKDLMMISKSSQIFIDCTNRFPCPTCNHMSFSSRSPITGKESNLLNEWLQKVSLPSLISPHIYDGSGVIVNNYFKEFLTNWDNLGELPFCITDLLKLLPVPSVNLVHYSGTDDIKFYNQKILGRKELEDWADEIYSVEEIKTSSFCFPEVGQIIHLF